MTCLQCSANNPDAAAFCNGCGRRLVAPPPPVPTAPPPSPAKKSNVGVTIVVLFFAALVAYTVITVNDDRPRATTLKAGAPDVNTRTGSPGVADVNTESHSVEKPRPNLELLDAKSEDRNIVGHIRNNSARTYRYVQVTFNLWDSDKATKVGSAMTNINGLDPGTVWKFTAHIFNQDAQNYSLSEISGR